MKTFKEFLNERLSSISPTKVGLGDEYEGGIVGGFMNNKAIIVSHQTKKLNWNDATKYCSELAIDGHSDWRLPTLKEAKKLQEEHEKWKMAFGNHWTKSNMGGTLKYFVFDKENNVMSDKTNLNRVRAIRLADF